MILLRVRPRSLPTFGGRSLGCRELTSLAVSRSMAHTDSSNDHEGNDCGPEQFELIFRGSACMVGAAGGL